jgi:PPOX class probable F420-dependent enzyme
VEEIVSLSSTTIEFLNEKRYATLATIGLDGAPSLSVMWYALDGHDILMNTKRGRLKDRHLLADNRASICVEDGYRYVTITGRITMNDDQTVAQADIAALATRYEGAERSAEMVASQFGNEERVTIRLSIDRISAHGF